MPAVNPVKVPVPLYGAVPPLAETEAEPLEPPLQDTFVTTEPLADKAVGSVMVTEVVAVQP